MSKLIQAIRGHRGLDKIAQLADEEKNINVKQSGESALDAVIATSEPSPSLNSEYIHRTNYIRGVLHILLDRHANAETIKNIGYLSEVIDVPLLTKLIKNGFNVDTQDEYGCTLLMCLIRNYTEIYEWYVPGRQQVFQEYNRSMEDTCMLLIENHTDVLLSLRNAKEHEFFYDEEYNGANVIHIMMSGIITPFIVELFRNIVNRDNINSETDNGVTPFIMYAKSRIRMSPHVRDTIPYPAMVEQFITSGADITARDNKGKTALDYAIENNDDAMITTLRQKERERIEGLQGALVAKGRQGFQHRVPPGIAKRITNFLGGKRKSQKNRKNRKNQKSRKAHTRCRK